MKWLLAVTCLVFCVVSVRMVSAQATYLVAGSYNQTHPLISYSGSWQTVTNANARGGNYTQTTTQYDILQFSCVCDGFRIIYWKLSVGASLRVLIDGYLHGQLTTQNPITTTSNQYEVTGMDAGYHTITVQMIQPPVSGTYYLVVEGIDVLNSVTSIPTQTVPEITVQVVFPEQTPEPTPAWRDEYEIFDQDGSSKTVAFEWTFTAGEVAVSVVLFGVLVVLIASFARESIGR